MSRRFDGATQYADTSTVAVSGAPMTVAAWINTDDAASTIDQVILEIYYGANYNHRFRLLLEGTTPADRGKPRWAVKDGVTTDAATATSAVSSGAWHHVAGVEISSSSRAVYLDGGSKGTASATKSPVAIDVSRLGADGGGTDFFDGMIAHTTVWDVALSDEEIYTLSRGVSPLRVRRQNLLRYYPLNGKRSPEPDIVGKINLTLVNSPIGDFEPRFPYMILAA